VVEGSASVKDRARPFSRKHFRYWMTAAGGMVIIMVINILLGFWLFWRDPPAQAVPHYLPIPASKLDAGVTPR
jgi:hypothetical protein